MISPPEWLPWQTAPPALPPKPAIATQHTTQPEQAPPTAGKRLHRPWSAHMRCAATRSLNKQCNAHPSFLLYECAFTHAPQRPGPGRYDHPAHRPCETGQRRRSGAEKRVSLRRFQCAKKTTFGSYCSPLRLLPFRWALLWQQHGLCLL